VARASTREEHSTGEWRRTLRCDARGAITVEYLVATSIAAMGVWLAQSYARSTQHVYVNHP
jgi:hypothetical protein